MFDYYENILCVQGGWLCKKESNIMSKANYDFLIHTNILKVLRRGGGHNNHALIDYRTIPERFKIKIIEQIGYDPEKKVKTQLKDQIQPDYEARDYFSKYRLPDGGRLQPETIQEYCNIAEALNAIGRLSGNRTGKNRTLGGKINSVWENLADQVSDFKRENTHFLPENFPENWRRLKDKWEKYHKESYLSLVHKGFLNDNTRKVSVDIERFILSLYACKNKSYVSTVHEKYLQFLGGVLEVVDITTGEVFNRSDFYDEKGDPIMLSESTIRNYINMPRNRILVDKIRSGRFEYINNSRPHYHRHSPFFSLSKISLDDRDLPRKMPDGTRVKAYYAYDVASGAVIGAAYSKSKDTDLFLACITDMFRFIEREHLGMPMEVEVEHHIVSQFKDDLMKAGVVFPFVRWCAPGNSQEKRAEHFNKAKKYGYEKRYQDGIGRWYARLEANRVDYDKIPSATNDKFKENTYSFEDLVADDLKIISLYNNDKHPKDKQYNKMSRLDVLRYHANPDAKPIQKEIIIRYIGEHTASSIRRNQYVRVQYNNYQLPAPEYLNKLQPNNYSVDCYYLPDEDGNIPEVYIYQDNQFIAACKKINTYNEAKVEQTDADHAAFIEQSKYIARFDKMVKDGTAKLLKLETSENSQLPEIRHQENPVVRGISPEETEIWNEDTQFYSAKGFDSL